MPPTPRRDRQPATQKTADLPPATGSDVVTLDHWHELPPPLFILAPPRSFTSIAGAMLGQHPQLYGLPETNLFCAETMEQWWALAAQATFQMAGGLLRTIGQLYFGAQNDWAVQMARQWLRHRSEVSTDFIFKTLADRVFPLVLVDKSPSTTSSLNVLQRTHGKFPNARYIHLLRHPRGHGESVIRLLEERRKSGPIPSTHWLCKSPLKVRAKLAQAGRKSLVLDPQFGWHARNRTICDFLAKIPAEQRMRVRGEDLLAEPDRILPEIASWMRLLNDVSAIDAMKHPERSPYAFLGPRGARWGNDPFFLQDPLLRPGRVRTHHLEGSLGWRSDGQGFSDEVLALAQEFGYS